MPYCNYVEFDSIAVGWEKIVDITLQGQGSGNPTSIPKNSFPAIALEAGEFSSFYIEVSQISYTDYAAGTVLSK